jgi:hypothetical protein
MAADTLSFRRASPLRRRYHVLLNGERIGTVERGGGSVEAGQGWRATTAAGEPLYPEGGRTGRTREQAAAVLVRQVEADAASAPPDV